MNQNSIQHNLDITRQALWILTDKMCLSCLDSESQTLTVINAIRKARSLKVNNSPQKDIEIASEHPNCFGSPKGECPNVEWCSEASNRACRDKVFGCIEEEDHV